MTKAKRTILPFFIPHQGCPHQCVFCNQHRITGLGNAIDFAAIEKQILSLSPGAPMEIAFYGGSFSGLAKDIQRRLLSPTWEQKRRGAVSHIRISTRPDYIDEERLLFLRQYGVDTIEIGAQSLDDEVLALSGRGHTREDIERAAKLIFQFGFQLIVQLLPGLPGDNEKQAVRGAKTVASWKPSGVRIYPAVVLGDTPLAKQYQQGLYQPLTVEEAARWCGDMSAFFLAKEVAIIRIGLQPTAELQGEGAVLAGAFHPAMGQLTQSYLALQQCNMLLQNCSDKNGCILAPERQLSTYLGQKKGNLQVLRQRYGDGLAILPDGNLRENAIVWQQEKGAAQKHTLSWRDFLTAYTEKLEENIK